VSVYSVSLMIDLFTADLNNLPNDDLYAAISDFARAQPNESNRHDFKIEWNDEALKDVAAFANTFGGLLIIGVRKGKTDTEATLVGVQTTSELTTRLASAIATNVSPIPSFNVVECHKPGLSNQRFAIISIRSDSSLHLVTKKGVGNPVLFRNIDETKPADAAQLRMMIEREQRTKGNSDTALWGRARNVLGDMKVGRGYSASQKNWFQTAHHGSDTFFKLVLIPNESRRIRLDLRSERQFLRLIHSHYRRVNSNLGVSPSVAVDTENRSYDFYEYRWYHKNMDYEGLWRVTNRLEIAHATQIADAGADDWSVVDIVAYTGLLLKIGATWWESVKYFGDGILMAELSVTNLKLLRGRAHQFLSMFGPCEADECLSGKVLLEAPFSETTAKGWIDLNFHSMRNEIPELISNLMNTMLRSLGHALLMPEFKDEVTDIVRSCGALT